MLTIDELVAATKMERICGDREALRSESTGLSEALAEEQVRRVVAEKERDALASLLRQLEWIIPPQGTGDDFECPACRSEQRTGHVDGCELIAALRDHGGGR